ncbi:methylated-DNA--[protein]-cysteine S-methyltransferase [Allopusillimonas ginsengisoli]|uniref:methylated-DNA--[protein]-cysteine S-methyltransferase n=1 Tax=Allopusillimonas ginsengisoli TaxID=453575 RepID=UPI0010C1D5BE|nr:methylated-DNA--[protein]-cysteine S-methyltransferase [Allopusillimonas ginsengisoli]
MVLHARFISPLGPVLLCAEHDQLTGLHFIGQKDCPSLDGLDISLTSDTVSHAGTQAGGNTEGGAAASTGTDTAKADNTDKQSDSGPSSGMHAGMPIKDFKVRRREVNNDLFSRENMVRTSGEPSHGPSSVTLGPIVVMQDNTPATTHEVFCQARSQLQEYFEGGRTVFTVSMLLQGTPFQKQVWKALLTIPYGEYVSYGDVALAAGLTRQHGRAVGKAVGENPISIIVPCHRVLAGTGRLNGYSGGLERKLVLLEIEGFDVV